MNQSTDKKFEHSGELTAFLLRQPQYTVDQVGRAVTAALKSGQWSDQWIRITYSSCTFTVRFLQ
jgi:hypothetical protein